MKLFILIIGLVAVQCRPQALDNADAQSEREKQDKSTKDILEKIAEVNKAHGLVPAPKKPSYFHFPFSYTREQSEPERQIKNYTLLNENEDENVVEDYPEEQMIRKVTHVQTFGVPMQPSPYQYQYPMFPPYMPNNQNFVNVKSVQEEEEANLPIKRKIVIKHEIQPIYSNPPMYQPPMYPMNGAEEGNLPSEPRQNWNWPGAQYFPIVIKDPFIQMYNAITTMIEYGPMAGGGAGNACKNQNRNKIKAEIQDLRTPKTVEENTVESVTENENNPNNTYLDIEGLRILMPEENDRQSKSKKSNDLFLAKRNELLNKVNKTVRMNGEHLRGQLARNTPSFIQSTSVSPPSREPDLEEDEFEEDESEKADNINVSSEGGKKVLSKDNTGSGIFIHRLKVRKGGVAIAGPGGIATAGSGGTAIVGPNGFAYTHPDSLAIAGSGTKVIAVEPSISLLDVVNQHNKTKDGSMPRMGKLVATGPVIYYNKG